MKEVAVTVPILRGEWRGGEWRGGWGFENISGTVQDARDLRAVGNVPDERVHQPVDVGRAVNAGDLPR